MAALAVTQLGIQHFGQLVSDLFIFGIHELRDENTWKKPREVIELDGEFSKLPVRNISRAKPGEIGIVDRTMPENEEWSRRGACNSEPGSMIYLLYHPCKKRLFARTNGLYGHMEDL